MRGMLQRALVGVALLGAGLAWAEPPLPRKAPAPQAQSDGAQAGEAQAPAPQKDAAAVPRGAQEVLGRVLLAEGGEVFLLDRAGTITRLFLDGTTRYEGGTLHRASDLQAGDEVRAAFQWRGIGGVATRIRRVAEGTVEHEGAPAQEE